MKRSNSDNTGRVSRVTKPLIGVAVVLGSLVAPLFTGAAPVYAAAGTQLYLSPASGMVVQNSTFAVAVRINASESVNAVQANFSYPASQLQFLEIKGDGSNFKIEAPSEGGNGTVSIARGQVGGVKGDALVATVTFKALAGSGSANLAFTAGTEAARNSDSKNALTGTTGAKYDFKSTGTSTISPPVGTGTNTGGGATPSPSGATPTPATPATPGTAPDAGGTTTPESSPTPPGAPATDTKNNNPQTNSNVSGKPTGATAAMWSISGLLIIAIAAVAGTVYFRRRHSALLAVPAYDTPMAGFKYGPPASMVNRFTGTTTPTITPTRSQETPQEPSRLVNTSFNQPSGPPSASASAVPTPTQALASTLPTLAASAAATVAGHTLPDHAVTPEQYRQTEPVVISPQTVKPSASPSPAAPSAPARIQDASQLSAHDSAREDSEDDEVTEAPDKPASLN